MSINIWIDNLTNFLTLFTKNLFSIFPKQLLHEIYAIWEIFHFYAFGNYAIWDAIQFSMEQFFKSSCFKLLINCASEKLLKVVDSINQI